MSFDQRPGKMRVVSDGSQSPKMRRTDDPAAAPPVAAPVALPAPAKQRLPILGAALFVIACALGGVAVAVVRPFGLG
ncbi:hypothetical protein [Sphingomonas sp. S2-65]|uniref:hypothetical protein n=1 Tax=Sphingomonas sp. S2-65 TaxID=2903960 RepID=UPI001F3394CA|nr:hypothetical protein [Sphingomonas sp. S2-65]UYY59703.1 hypothetical protein LZ586_06355 [Sphingomonas sp. S2-65]